MSVVGWSYGPLAIQGSEWNLLGEQPRRWLTACEDAAELEGVHRDGFALTVAPVASRWTREVQGEGLAVATCPLAHDVVYEHTLMVGSGVHGIPVAALGRGR